MLEAAGLEVVAIAPTIDEERISRSAGTTKPKPGVSPPFLPRRRPSTCRAGTPELW